MTIYTIGHSDRPFPSFLRLLRAHGIELLVDVRRHPGSRKHPQYNREALAAALAEAGIEYTFLGDTLGGRRERSVPEEESPNRGLTHPSFRNYADYMRTPAFRRGVEDLLTLAADRKAAIMCSEGWWVTCHRRLLADALVARGIEVRHIASGVRADPHVIDPAAVVTGKTVSYPPASE